MRYPSSVTKWLLFGLLILAVLGLDACGSFRGSDASSGEFDANNIPDAVPQAEAHSKYGNPTSYVVHGKRYYVLKDAKGYDKTGLASWYGTKFHGQHTSSRESYNMYSMTAASPVLPIPTYVKVTNLQNGRTAIVKVNDRGPFRSSRIIDLSYAAAVKLGYANKGTANVRVTVIDPTSPSPSLFFAQNKVAPPVQSDNTQIGVGSISSDSLHNPPNPLTQLAAADSHNSPLYVQVGAYHNRQSAESTRQKIKKLTNQTQVAVEEATNGKSHVYRVHIGPLKDAGESTQMTQLLAKNGFQKAMVVTS